MIVKKFSGGNIGKLGNIKLELTEGLNLFYSREQERLAHVYLFLKAILYGQVFWKQEFSGSWGELHLEDLAGHYYILQRKFLSGKRNHDKFSGVQIQPDQAADWSLTDRYTGQTVVIPVSEQPGRYFYGCEAEEFERFYIMQARDKRRFLQPQEQDRLLENLSQCGDENLSYAKVMETLVRAQEKVDGFRNRESGDGIDHKGVLKQLKEEYQKLRAEWNRTDKLLRESREAQIELKLLQDKKKVLEETIAEWEGRRQQVEILKKNPDYRALRRLIERITASSAQKEALDRSFTLRVPDEIGFAAEPAAKEHLPQFADAEFISRFKEDYATWSDLKRQWGELEQKYREAERRLEFLEVSIPLGYRELEEEYANLDLDFEQKVVAAELEKKTLRAKLEEMDRQKKELCELESFLAEEKRTFSQYYALAAVDATLMNEIRVKEEQLRALRQEIAASRSLIPQLECYPESLINIGTFFLLAGLLGGQLINLYFNTLALTGLGVVFFGVYKQHKLERLILMETEISTYLENIYREFRVDGYHDLTFKLRAHADQQSRIGELEANIQALRRELLLTEEERISGVLEEETQFINKILRICHCSGLGEWQSGLAHYKKIKQKLHALATEQEDLNTQLMDISEARQSVEGVIKEKLDLIGLPGVELEQANEIYHKLTVKWMEKVRLEQEIEVLTEQFQTLLQERDMALLAQKLQPIAALEREQGIHDEDGYKNLIRGWQEKLALTAQAITATENLSKTIPVPARTLMQIEEEIEKNEEKIQYYERVRRSLKLAQEVMQESYRELQQRLGMKLHNEAAAILEEIIPERKINGKGTLASEERLLISQAPWEQAYFALKLGVSTIWQQQNGPGPLIMEEPFWDYDNVSLDLALEFMQKYSTRKNDRTDNGEESNDQTRQIILLTVQERIWQRLRNIPGVNVYQSS